MDALSNLNNVFRVGRAKEKDKQKDKVKDKTKEKYKKAKLYSDASTNFGETFLIKKQKGAYIQIILLFSLLTFHPNHAFRVSQDFWV